jgi:hypothetical protein
VAGGGWVGAALAAAGADAVAAGGGAVAGLGGDGAQATAPRARATQSLRIESDLQGERSVRRPGDRGVGAGNTCITRKGQDD